MPNYKRGVRIIEKATELSTPVVASSGIPFVIGTAPVHQVDGKTQEVIMAIDYGDAISQTGYSDDWEKYSLCEVIYSQFKLFKVAPLFMVNVLDPKKHNQAVAEEDYPILDNQVEVPFEAIVDTIKAKDGATELVADEDYMIFYDGSKLLLEVLEGGNITSDKLKITFDAVDPSKVTKEDIMGGYDLVAKKSTGLELLNDVYPKYQYVPDLISCPGYSHDPEVAAIMAAKVEGISGQFTGHCVIDADSESVLSYSDVPAWKKTNNIYHPRQIVLWPKAKLGDRVFHLSTLAIGRMGATDYREECPTESPSNEPIFINGLILDDEEHTEVVIDEPRGKYLNKNGIVTGKNSSRGFVLWGNETACYPGNTDIKDYFINISRMFSWTGNTIVHTLDSKVDRNIKVRVIENIVNSMNIWFNGLVANEKILGGRVEFRREENSDLDLMGGVVTLHYSLGFSPPMKAIDNILEYDASYLASLFTI